MSHSGNTKIIAEAIFQEIQEEKEIKELNEIDDLEGYDLAFVGFPMHGFGAPEEAKDFLEKQALRPRGNQMLRRWNAHVSSLER